MSFAQKRSHSKCFQIGCRRTHKGLWRTVDYWLNQIVQWAYLPLRRWRLSLSRSREPREARESGEERRRGEWGGASHHHHAGGADERPRSGDPPRPAPYPAAPHIPPAPTAPPAPPACACKGACGCWFYPNSIPVKNIESRHSSATPWQITFQKISVYENLKLGRSRCKVLSTWIILCHIHATLSSVKLLVQWYNLDKYIWKHPKRTVKCFCTVKSQNQFDMAEKQQLCFMLDNYPDQFKLISNYLLPQDKPESHKTGEPWSLHPLHTTEEAQQASELDSLVSPTVRN